MLSEDIKLTLVQEPLADGQTDPDSDRVDMSGYDGVLFVGILGTIADTGTVTLTAKQAATDIVGTALTDGSVEAAADDDDKLLVIDIFRPTKRYVGTTLTRGTANSVYGGTLAIQYKARSRPTTQAAAQLAAAMAQLVSPAEAS